MTKLPRKEVERVQLNPSFLASNQGSYHVISSQWGCMHGTVQAVEWTVALNNARTILFWWLAFVLSTRRPLIGWSSFFRSKPNAARWIDYLIGRLWDPLYSHQSSPLGAHVTWAAGQLIRMHPLFACWTIGQEKPWFPFYPRSWDTN